VEWLGRFCTRLMNLSPELGPLDAARRAAQAFAAWGGLVPEAAAEELVACDNARRASR
jgi:hypothetical protein